MSPTIDPSGTDEPGHRATTEIPGVLAKWYAAHASVRRLWAVENQDALTVFVALEPTSDGDDAFPIWLANSREWVGDLGARTNRDVELKLIVSDGFEEADVAAGATKIADLRWRDAWFAIE